MQKLKELYFLGAKESGGLSKLRKELLCNMFRKQKETKLALSNGASRADGSNTPEGLLEGCINNQTVTQAFVVRCSAKGKVLGKNKMALNIFSSTTCLYFISEAIKLHNILEAGENATFARYCVK